MSRLFEVTDLLVNVYDGEDWTPAVRGASFGVDEGSVLALVGESGSGKSLMAMGAVDLLRRGARVEEGTTVFLGNVLQEVSEAQWRTLVGVGIGVLLQDAVGSWDPTDFIGDQSGEVLEEHFAMDEVAIRERVLNALGEVKLPKRRKFFSFSYQMSRGEAQRAMLAATLLSSPSLLIADEPLSGLDPTVARAVLDIIEDLRRERGMGMIYVTHDLGMVAGIADRVAVVYGGSIIEEGPVRQIFESPLHPYTEGLLGSIPWPDVDRLRPIPGDVPEITRLPAGCPFAPRCAYAESSCLAAVPPPEMFGPTTVRCIRAGGLELRGVKQR